MVLGCVDAISDGIICFQAGKTAEFFLEPDNQSSNSLTHREILKLFRAEEDYADDMLSDQGILLRYDCIR